MDVPSSDQLRRTDESSEACTYSEVKCVRNEDLLKRALDSEEDEELRDLRRHFELI